MAKRKALAMQKARLPSPGRWYPGVQGRVVDYSHSIEDGTLCVNVCFKDKALFSFRFACDPIRGDQIARRFILVWSTIDHTRSE